MGYSDISVTINTYTHLSLEDAAEEMGRMQESEKRPERAGKTGGQTVKTKMSRKMFQAGYCYNRKEETING